MKKNAIKLICLILCFAMAAVMFAGCGGSEGAPKETEKAPASTAAPAPGAASAAPAPAAPAEPVKETVVIASSAEPPTLDPINQTSLMSMQMALLMYNRLFTLDQDLNVAPSLVDTYKNVSDTEWDFKLKKGIKFHDGSDLTSEDVKATLEYCLTNKYAGNYVSTIDRIEVVDDLNFKIITKEPSVALCANLTQSATSILPSELLKAGHDFNAEPCGSGPFKFASWTSGEKIEFERYDDYFEGPAGVKYLTWKVIPESSARTIALEAGEVDLLFNVSTIDVASLKENPDIGLLFTDSVNQYSMSLNGDVAPYDNKLVRKAINAAIDKQSIVDAALNGYGSVCLNCIPNGLPGESSKNSDTYDVAKAKQYLKDSGVDPASFTMTITCTDDTRMLVGQIIQANLGEIGITVKLESQDYATFIAKESAGDYNAAIGGIANNIAINYLRRAFHSSQIGAANFCRFNDPEVDAAIDKALMTLDDAKRAAIVTGLIEKMNDLLITIPLYQDQYIRAYNSKLGGVDLNGCYFSSYHKLYWKS